MSFVTRTVASDSSSLARTMVTSRKRRVSQAVGLRAASLSSLATLICGARYQYCNRVSFESTGGFPAILAVLRVLLPACLVAAVAGRGVASLTSTVKG